MRSDSSISGFEHPRGPKQDSYSFDAHGGVVNRLVRVSTRLFATKFLQLAACLRPVDHLPRPKSTATWRSLHRVVIMILPLPGDSE